MFENKNEPRTASPPKHGFQLARGVSILWILFKKFPFFLIDGFP